MRLYSPEVLTLLFVAIVQVGVATVRAKAKDWPGVVWWAGFTLITLTLLGRL